MIREPLINWTLVCNRSSTGVPPFAVMEVDQDSTVSDDGAIPVRRPTRAGATDVFFNGPSPIAPYNSINPTLSYGQGHQTFPAIAAYQDGATPEIGEIWTTAAGSWLLQKNIVRDDHNIGEPVAAAGFLIVGGAAAGLVNVIRNPEPSPALVAVRAYVNVLPPDYTRTGNKIIGDDGAGPIASKYTGGITLVEGDRFLINLPNALGGEPENGVWNYHLNDNNDWSASRSQDADTSARMRPGLLVEILEGNEAAGTIWRLATLGPITLNTTRLNFLPHPLTRLYLTDEYAFVLDHVREGHFMYAPAGSIGGVILANGKSFLLNITGGSADNGVWVAEGSQPLTHLTGSDWGTATAYAAGDYVSNDDVQYQCIADHTSSGDDEPGVGPNWGNYWESIDTERVYKRVFDLDRDEMFRTGLLVEVDPSTYHYGLWQLETADPITLDTTPLTFEKIAPVYFNGGKATQLLFGYCLGETSPASYDGIDRSVWIGAGNADIETPGVISVTPIDQVQYLGTGSKAIMGALVLDVAGSGPGAGYVRLLQDNDDLDSGPFPSVFFEVGGTLQGYVRNDGRIVACVGFNVRYDGAVLYGATSLAMGFAGGILVGPDQLTGFMDTEILALLQSQGGLPAGTYP